MKPSEAWLQYVWQNGILKPGLQTDDNRRLQIRSRGSLNHHAGPDFSNAVIGIGDTTWVGNVEIHIRSSEWTRHGHHLDPAYDNVILHVVMEKDDDAVTSQGEIPPTLVVARFLYQDSWHRYLSMLGRRTSIPCGPYIRNVEQVYVLKLMERMAAERVATVVAKLNTDYQLSGLEPDQIAYQRLGRSMGFQVNADAFSILCKALPYRILRKTLNEQLLTEALVFGSAGLLEPGVGGYAERLLPEWEHLQRRYDLYPMRRSAWKYARTRQSNNPELRLAQFAALLCSLQPLFDTLTSVPIEEVRVRMQPRVSDYWRDNDLLRGRSHTFRKFSNAVVDTLMINTVIPLREFSVMTLGQVCDSGLANLELLAMIGPEDNRISRLWGKLGIQGESALDTQGLLHLYRIYCRRKRCLECPVSVRILGPGNRSI